ncbi:MAG: formate/nitrite transporter family protein [Lachnospiraceae bacterium]|nr:formate/nitrite transporter family protein [Lachnospiraceae bacterium]
MDRNFKVPKEMVEGYICAGREKVEMLVSKMIILGMMAGAFVAFGASSSSLAVHAIDNAGAAKVIAGAIFPVGLMLIIFIGGELFTGDCLMIMGHIKGEYSFNEMVARLLLVLGSNLIGAMIVAVFVYFAGQFDMSGGALGAYTIKVAYGKVSLSFLRAFISGILCNILVCGAVLMAASAKDVAGKILAIFFPIFAFVIGGYEHCVANMYYIPAGILALGNSAYREKAMELYGYTQEQLATINYYNFFVHNIIPVTLGNIVGGMVFVGLPLYYLHVSKVDKTQKKEIPVKTRTAMDV